MSSHLENVVDHQQNATALETILKCNNIGYQITIFPDANHLFLSAKTGGIDEYARLEQTFTTDFLPTIDA